LCLAWRFAQSNLFPPQNTTNHITTMIIQTIHDITTIQNDIKAMSKAIASLKKHRAQVKKVKIAINSSRLTEERGQELLSSLHSEITNDLFIIQDRGMALGQGDIGKDHEESAVTMAQYIITTTK